MSKDEVRERVMKAACEITQENRPAYSDEVATRSGIGKRKVSQILWHNFHRMNFLRGYDSESGSVVYVSKENNDLPNSIKITTTLGELDRLKMLDYSRELAKIPEPRISKKKKAKIVTNELVDEVMEDLKKEKGRFSYQNILDNLVIKVNRGLRSKDKYIALAQFEERINPGENQRYIFSKEDGCAGDLKKGQPNLFKSEIL